MTETEIAAEVPPSDPAYDIEFFWDPVCPFSWITSRWIDRVAQLSDLRVDWRFISLRLINQHLDYEKDFPPEYEKGHTAGLRLLRVAASVRAVEGRRAMPSYVAATGASYWDQPKGSDIRERLGSTEHAVAVLEAAGLPTEHAAALDDDRWDALLDAEGQMALSRTGSDVGTPIITYQPPDGLSFFGPVISRIPDDDEAVELWDAVMKLAAFPGFAELKRSLRERPQLRIAGTTDEPSVREDWRAGARAGHRPGDTS